MNTAAILLVEDEPSSVFFAHTAKKLNIANPLRIAQDGREALDYLKGVGGFADRQKYPMPGLIIMDLKMPRATGFDVLRQIRADPELRTLIVVMLTSSASDADIRRAYELGANAYLVKPLHLEELMKIVKAIQDFWLMQNHFVGERARPGIIAEVPAGSMSHVAFPPECMAMAPVHSAA